MAIKIAPKVAATKIYGNGTTKFQSKETSSDGDEIGALTFNLITATSIDGNENNYHEQSITAARCIGLKHY